MLEIFGFQGVFAPILNIIPIYFVIHRKIFIIKTQILVLETLSSYARKAKKI
jgi:hypothetical protein